MTENQLKLLNENRRKFLCHITGKQDTTCFRHGWNQGLRISSGPYFSGCLLVQALLPLWSWRPSAFPESRSQLWSSRWKIPSLPGASSKGLQWCPLGLALILCLSLNQSPWPGNWGYIWANIVSMPIHVTMTWGQTYLIHLEQGVHWSVGYVTSRRGKDWWTERWKRMTRTTVVEV